MTKLCARGKAAAKRKFRVYPSAYANAYASKICAGKIKDPSGMKRKDWGPKKARTGILIEQNPDLKDLRKERRKKDVKKYGPRKRNFPKSDGDGLFDILIKGAEILNKPPAKKIGGEAKVKEVAKALHKASGLHKAQAKALDSVTKANEGLAIEVLKEESQKIIDNFPKKKKKKYIRDPQSRDKMQPSKSMLVDYGKKVTTVENYSRGGGIAIRGMGFKGVF